MKFCENLSKISRHKSIYSCLNSTNIRTRKDILSNSIYLNNKINSNKPYSTNLKYEFADINNRYSPPCIYNKISYFSNEKENRKKHIINDYNNSYYSNNNKSLYFNNPNSRVNYSSYCLRDKPNNNNNNSKIEIIINNNNNSNDFKERKTISKIKLYSNKTNAQKFYCKNNSFKNNNTSIIKYSQNIVNKNKQIYIDKCKYRYMSSNNISLPKRVNKCQNYDGHIPFNKDSNKNNLYSERVHYKSYKTILNEENNKENINMNKNNTFLDQQILDYLNRNYEEKNNLIKKMNNQKINYYKKTLEDNNLLLNYNYYNDNSNKNNKTKIITLNNLNNYSCINNNYNYYWNNNYNSMNNNELLNSKNYNSKMKPLYPNFIKNRIKKSVNKTIM